MSDVDLRQMANAIRFLSMDAIERAGEGHPGTPLGAAEIATALFVRHLKFNPKDPLWFDRDRFVLSNGHGSMLLYSLLCLTGYERMSINEIKRFRVLGSHTAGHPERNPAAGIEVVTGLLGQGIANAAGMAVAEAFLSNWLGSEVVNHYTFALVGDGCLQEGVGHEIISLAGHLQLGKLIFLWDDNSITDDGCTDLALSDDVLGRFRISNWHVQEVDGHDPDAVAAAILIAKQDPRPSVIRCTTVIGRGIPRIEGTRAAHGGRIVKEDTDAARISLNWPHPPFEIPANIRAAWLAAGDRSTPEYKAWQDRVAELGKDKRRLLDRLREGRLPDGWEATLVDFKRRAAETGCADHGYKISGDIFEAVAKVIPELISGAPDLEGATQHKRHLRAFTSKDRGGRYIHYGVREHAMGSMMNGMAAHGGVLPCGVTYLVFSDYNRAAIRMAAMMSLPVIFVYSHDSIGVGTNGPTHQPVEFLANLRALPNMLVLRPADAMEAAECWQIAIANRGGPSSLIFSRQPIQAVRPSFVPENMCSFGAYVLEEAACGKRRATIFATGSEVAIVLKARQLLETEGIATAVVSMPCWELFDRQPDDYKQFVVDRSTVRVAVEAAVQQGWEKYIGEEGGFVGLDRFGASGSVEDLYAYFGITPERVADEVRKRV